MIRAVAGAVMEAKSSQLTIVDILLYTPQIIITLVKLFYHRTKPVDEQSGNN